MPAVRLALLTGVLLLQACATQGPLMTARQQYDDGDYPAALATLDSGDIASRNRLLALLDRGMVNHAAGDYSASIRDFLEAAALVEELDRISVTETSASLITNDWATHYRGEYSERLWIHTFQMMNFLVTGQPESAAVEARQALKLIDAHGKVLRNDFYTRALIALSFELAGQFDSAHIEYRKLVDDMPAPTGIVRRAWQNAVRLGRADDASRFAALLGQTPSRPSTTGARGELIVFVTADRIARKIPGDILVDVDARISFPYYPPRFERPPTVLASVRAGIDATNGAVDPATQDVDVLSVSLTPLARASLEARAASMTVKYGTRLALKDQLGDAAHREDALLGGLVRVMLFVLEQADTRSWETLPGSLALVQLPLEPGVHDVTLSITSRDGYRSVEMPAVEIRNGYPAIRIVHLPAGT